MSDNVLEMRDVEKRFGATLALDSVSLELKEREILALLGDNGAGKSTLIKILSGVLSPDSGEILVGGEQVRIDSPHRARELGIETVYQDLALFDNFNATGNFYAGREPVRPSWLGSLGWVSDRQMAKETGPCSTGCKSTSPVTTRSGSCPAANARPSPVLARSPSASGS